MSLPEMTDAETVAHLREYVKAGGHGPFAWPTDGCGYEQHIRFVRWRNERWADFAREAMFNGTPNQGKAFYNFVLDYADRLERGEFKKQEVKA